MWTGRGVSARLQKLPEFRCLAVHLGFRGLCGSSAVFKPHQNLWKVSVSTLFLCRLPKVVVMETVCLADVGFVFTGSVTAELKTGSNITQCIGSEPLKNPRC